MNRLTLLTTIALGAVATPVAIGSSGASPLPDPFEFVDDYDLTELSLEELMDIEVTIATRSSEPMAKIPAAVYVLTGDEIRRSGHTSIAEALRMVPGFHVSHWMTASWDVTSRGFGPGLAAVNSAYLNQLLVMIDGVVVYTPLFAGVWWGLQDYPLENIERIEVVRGPAGILWGTNAVHGVVNVITKKAEDTQGAMASLRYGTDEGHGTVRYGGQIGEDTYYNAWFKGAQYDTLHNPYQAPFSNDWGMMSAGARFDFKAFEQDFNTWTRVYDGKFDTLGFDLDTYDPIQVRDDRRGAQLYAAMTDPEVGSRWQAWFTTDQQDLPTLADIQIDEFDLEYQHPFQLGDSNRLNVGAGYRWTHSRTYGDDPFWYTFDPEVYTKHTFRVFAADTIALDSLKSSLTLGLALEYNTFTDFELQPTIRYAWMPRDDYMMWGAISRAVRTPSIEERHLTDDSYFLGDKNFKSEEVISYELGARVIPAEWVSADLAVFFNQYDFLHSNEPADRWWGDVWGYQLNNEGQGDSYGVELALDFRITENWKIRSAYTYEHGEFETRDGRQMNTGEYSPRHEYNLRSYYDLGQHWEFDVGGYGVDGLGDYYTEGEYFRLDARLGWLPDENFEFYIGAQGTTEPYRSELFDTDEVPRQLYVGVRIKS